MNKQGKGLTLTTALLAVLAISVAGCGVATWNNQKDKNYPNYSQNSGKAENSKTAKVAKDQNDTHKTYSVKELPFAFKYPAGWSAKVEPASNARYYVVYIEAPGTALTSGPGYPSISSGARISINSDTDGTGAVKSLSEFKGNGLGNSG